MRALGIETARDGSWWTYAAPAPNIYFTAVSLAAPGPDPAAAVAALRRHRDDGAGGHVVVCDSWDGLALEELGLERKSRGRWCIRPAGPLEAAPAPEGLQIERVHDARALAAFEHTMVEGFGARFPIAPFGIHALGILDDPAMHVFLGRHDGRAVSVSMAYEHADLVGVYGVATVAGARGRGFATALTRAALLVDVTRPAMLQPTVEAWPIYEGLGFVDIGSFSHWG